MNERVFQYGGLSVKLFHSDKYGWVTTTPELARGCGVDRSTLERVCKRHKLVMKESVVEDSELGAKLHPFQRGPKPKVFWTIEGMTFVAMYMGTETCEQFRNEVLKTIKSLEAQGFMSNAEVMQTLETLRKMVEQLQLESVQSKATIEKLSEIVLHQQNQMKSMAMAEQAYASSAGHGLLAAKYTKHLRLMN